MRALVGLLFVRIALADVSLPAAVEPSSRPAGTHDLFLGVDKLGHAAFVRRDEFRVTALDGERPVSRCQIFVFDDNGELLWTLAQNINVIVDGRITDASWDGDKKKLPISPRATCEDAIAALGAQRDWKPAAAVAAIGVAKDMYFFGDDTTLAGLGSETTLNREYRNPPHPCKPFEGRWRRFRAPNSRASFVARYAEGDEVPSRWLIIPRGWHLRSGDGCAG